MVVGTYHFHLHGPSGQRGPSPRYKHEEHSGGYKPGSYGYEAVRDCCFKKHGKWWYITKETIGWFVSGCIDFSWEIADWSKSRISKSIIESWNLKDTLSCLHLCRDSKCLPHCLDYFTKRFQIPNGSSGPEGDSTQTLVPCKTREVWKLTCLQFIQQCKTHVTFHCTGWLIRILQMAHYSPEPIYHPNPCVRLGSCKETLKDPNNFN